jgi:hypothetical protein
MLWVCLSLARIKEFFFFILEENPVQSAFQQTLGDELTFKQDNNLKHKAKSTLEFHTKTTLNVPEWPSYS